MNEHRFELLVSWVLLGFAVWYGATMASYPDNAGRIPVITAAVMAGALVVQIVSLYWRRSRVARDAEPVAEERRGEFEKDSYDSLIAIDGVRRRRFLTIAAFAIAFYLGIVLAGFVVTTGVLIAAILLTAREKLYTAVIGGLLSASAAYGLVVSLMGLQPWTGYLFSG